MTEWGTGKVRTAMRKFDRRFWIWLALSLGWMIFIFMKSAEPYTEQDLRPLLASVIPEDVVHDWIPRLSFYYDGGLVTWTKPYDFVEFFIRKGAHVTEYAILCLLLVNALRTASLSRAQYVSIGGAASFLYACSDEWHQTFVSGRTGHFIDVMVDSIGILIVIVIFMFIPRKKSIRNPSR